MSNFYCLPGRAGGTPFGLVGTPLAPFPGAVLTTLPQHVAGSVVVVKVLVKVFASALPDMSVRPFAGSAIV